MQLFKVLMLESVGVAYAKDSLMIWNTSLIPPPDNSKAVRLEAKRNQEGNS